jgi:hypothetical protein
VLSSRSATRLVLTKIIVRRASYWRSNPISSGNFSSMAG